MCIDCNRTNLTLRCYIRCSAALHTGQAPKMTIVMLDFFTYVVTHCFIYCYFFVSLVLLHVSSFIFCLFIAIWKLQTVVVKRQSKAMVIFLWTIVRHCTIPNNLLSWMNGLVIHIVLEEAEIQIQESITPCEKLV